MCDTNYSYTLYKFDRPGMNGHISVNVTPERVGVEDYTIGPDVAAFFGRDEHEYDVSVGVEEATAILHANGIAPGPYPTEKLALRLAERFAGSTDAATRFKELAEEVGVEPSVWVR